MQHLNIFRSIENKMAFGFEVAFQFQHETSLEKAVLNALRSTSDKVTPTQEKPIEPGILFYLRDVNLHELYWEYDNGYAFVCFYVHSMCEYVILNISNGTFTITKFPDFYYQNEIQTEGWNLKVVSCRIQEERVPTPPLRKKTVKKQKTIPKEKEEAIAVPPLVE
jgi:hypothetical protein